MNWIPLSCLAITDVWSGLGASLIFGLAGILLLMIGYFVFEYLTAKLNVQEELAKGNLAVAVVVAALLLSIAWIVAQVVS